MPCTSWKRTPERAAALVCPLAKGPFQGKPGGDHSISSASPEGIQDICIRNLVALCKISGQGPVGVILCISRAGGKHLQRAEALPRNPVKSHLLRILITKSEYSLGVA